ncbi:MOSC domain-containing protein [Actinocorallia sp. API 0066]|uniref:MOSC domain-containing protein n=1 Tax=Actinocorallia sp. API 0066 TaxID=2896846 RepID=UPI001E45714A|nr:MOSC domain-containing protein [Actinocorallia sp. API 0066]MCD0453471.1 MOSC domain-containing protein [Actinocorallia sp. API 0066]
MNEISTVGGVYVGTPAPLGPRRVLSAIRKEPVTRPSLALGVFGLDGDRQADLSVHGGPDKAVYLYPAAHYGYWTGEGYDLGPGGVGENVSVTGPDEHEIRIGDVWAWGEARVQVSQPRSPCFKFGLRAGRKEAVAQMITTARTGWYLRVLRPGTVPTSGELRLLERDERAPTVNELFSTSYAREFDPAELLRMVSTPALADQWRAGVLMRLNRTGLRT